MESQYSNMLDEILNERKDSYASEIKKLKDIVERLKENERELEKQYQKRQQVLFFLKTCKKIFCRYMIGLVHRLVEIEVEFILEDSLEVIKYTCFRPKIAITNKTRPSYWLYSLLTVNYNFK